MTRSVLTSDLTDTILTDTISITSTGIGAVGSSLDWSNITLSPQYTYTTNNTGGIWTNGLNGTSGASINPSGTMELMGENADIKIRGKSMVDWMEKVEERLNILTPNKEMEAEWDELRELGERYRDLERKCKEKGEMWNKLKSLPNNE